MKVLVDVKIIILDKIRSRIESQKREVCEKYLNDKELRAYYNGLNDGLSDAINIIDKYKEEKDIQVILDKSKASSAESVDVLRDEIIDDTFQHLLDNY